MKLIKALKYNCCDNCKYNLKTDKTSAKYGKRKRNEDNHWCFSQICVNPNCNDFDKIILIIKNWFKRNK